MRALLATLAIAAALLWPQGASASLKLCNRTSYILYAATGSQQGAGVVTKGWTRIVPGACQTGIDGALNKMASFVYARTSHAHNGPARAWGGNVPLCVRDNNFNLALAAGDWRCEDKQAYALSFARIDSHGKADWTMNFSQVPPLPTAQAAEQAGIARLLGDAGETKGLAAFRTRMKMPANIGASELLDALETEALNVAAPAGYSICNDTEGPIFAAMALKDGAQWHTRGWWQVLPGSCAQAISQALNADAVYLLVEDKTGRRLVQGPEMFCITQISFEVEGRNDCKSRGLVSAGFVRTDTKGRQGHAAHVSEDGLLPALMRGTE